MAIRKVPHFLEYDLLFAVVGAGSAVTEVGLVMPWCHDDLNAWLNKEPSYGSVMSTALHLAHTLRFAHERKIFHSDIKPENIMFEHNIPKICDWAYGKSPSNFEKASTEADGWTLLYRPPESRLSSRFDVFSLGLVILTMLRSCKNGPDDPSSTNRKLRLIIQGDSKTTAVPWNSESINRVVGELMDHVSADWKTLLTKMLACERKYRPSIHQVVESIEAVRKGEKRPPFTCKCGSLSVVSTDSSEKASSDSATELDEHKPVLSPNILVDFISSSIRSNHIDASVLEWMRKAVAHFAPQDKSPTLSTSSDLL
jgi:serine/threonine protein kinase